MESSRKTELTEPQKKEMKEGKEATPTEGRLSSSFNRLNRSSSLTKIVRKEKKGEVELELFGKGQTESLPGSTSPSSIKRTNSIIKLLFKKSALDNSKEKAIQDKEFLTNFKEKLQKDKILLENDWFKSTTYDKFIVLLKSRFSDFFINTAKQGYWYDNIEYILSCEAFLKNPTKECFIQEFKSLDYNISYQLKEDLIKLKKDENFDSDTAKELLRQGAEQLCLSMLQVQLISVNFKSLLNKAYEEACSKIEAPSIQKETVEKKGFSLRSTKG